MILTWDNIIKRGGCGLNKCALCGSNNESINDFFLSVLSLESYGWRFALGQDWQPDGILFHLRRIFGIWSKAKIHWTSLPCFAAWEVWKAYNLLIFEDKQPNLSWINSKVLASFNKYNGVSSIHLVGQAVLYIQHRA